MCSYLLLVCNGLPHEHTFDTLFHGILLGLLNEILLGGGELGRGEQLDLPLGAWTLQQWTRLVGLQDEVVCTKEKQLIINVVHFVKQKKITKLQCHLVN